MDGNFCAYDGRIGCFAQCITVDFNLPALIDFQGNFRHLLRSDRNHGGNAVADIAGGAFLQTGVGNRVSVDRPRHDG